MVYLVQLDEVVALLPSFSLCGLLRPLSLCLAGPTHPNNQPRLSEWPPRRSHLM